MGSVFSLDRDCSSIMRSTPGFDMAGSRVGWVDCG
jgi:hypothetical protein